jgi:Patatin-like phospholipase
MDEVSVAIDQRPPKTFELGVALAGAISAGAYTAGVLDFLFQALSEWEANREPSVEAHRVVIKVIAGASAGAITGALSIVALSRGLAPQEIPSDFLFYPDTYEDHQRWKCVLPALYQTWVELPRMVPCGDKRGFLGLDDLITNTKLGTADLRSLFNAAILDDIKRAAIEPLNTEAAQQPNTHSWPFIAKDLHIYMTISNLRGIPFKVAFGRSSYGMQTMGDRIHYVVADLGSADTARNKWLDNDTSVPISVKTLPTSKGQSLGEWDVYGTSAIASGAFPIGLASRNLSRPWADYLKRRYPLNIPPDVTIAPDFPAHLIDEGKSFVFESVDGGLVNNDPFDYAQYALFGGPVEPASGDTVQKAIVMVAPFPESPAFPPEGTPSPTVTAIVRALFPALVNQSRFRASELGPALNERDFSRFLIAPLRRRPRASGAETTYKPAERFAIACGLLGGFGGFIDEEFRAHDFQLGRRNCQQFLKTSFLVGPNNAVVGHKDGAGLQPVIPLLGSAKNPVRLPQWPQIDGPKFDELCRKITVRLDSVVPALINAQTQSKRLRIALRIGWRLFVRRPTLSFLRSTILGDLVRRQQIRGYSAEPLLQRIIEQYEMQTVDSQAIIAELINPNFDYRTPAGIAKAAHLRVEFVEAVLKRLTCREAPASVRAWCDKARYCLFDRRPKWRWRAARWVAARWNPPRVS